MKYLVVFLLLSSLLIAGTAGTGGEHLSHGVLFAAGVVNFSLFLFLIVKLGKPMAVSFFDNREKQIRTSFESYREMYEHAEAKIKEIRRAIEELPHERERLLASYRQRAADHYAAVMAEAQRRAELIRRDAEQAILDEENARRAALIRSFALNLHNDLTTRARTLDPSRRRALILSFGSLAQEVGHDS